ncbi:Carboxylic ester hydrolase OS=Streptomyces microflavus OX=1919 GN=Smic_79980 PE=4 SV=1 [Streptomyces microflavus]
MPSTITGLPLSGPEALTVFGAITLVLARWLPDRFRGPATLAAGALLVGSVTVLVVGGLRWQLVPVVAAAAVAAPFALVPMVRRRTGRTPWRARWWLALPGSAVCAALIASGPVSAWALPVPEFPSPQDASRSAPRSWSSPASSPRASPAAL